MVPFRFCLFLSAIFMVVVVPPVSVAQLTRTETRLLFQVQRLLEYPQALQGWTNWTNFCYLPPSPSLNIVCVNSRVTELTILGNKTTPVDVLSDKFSIDALFTVLTKLSSLKVLSLVSLGLWGPLPPKINRFRSLQVLNMSSNSISGQIPKQIASFQNLTTLVLSDNLFNGSVPDLTGLSQLEDLNLGGNSLGPQFPSLNKGLVSIILSNNSFRSEIPSGLKKFNQLQKLDVSSNEILGPIPSFLFSLPSIQYLNLAQNQLSGPLASTTSCGKKLTFVDISNNLLIGKLPSCMIGSNSRNRRVVSSWNCLSGSGGNSNRQHPYSFCNKQALAVQPVQEKKQEPGINLGLILGIIGGVVVIAGGMVVLILVIVRRSKRSEEDANDERSVADKMSIRSSPKPAIESRRVPQTMRSAAIGLPRYRVFSLEELEDATNNFDPSNFMGEGTQGQLYKGWLVDGSVVVKCMKLKQKHAPQNLMQHMEVLSKLRHRHLVSVLGHCIVTYQDHPNIASTLFVVFEHIANGSLRDYLTDWRKKEILKWPQRMAITIGAARGVQFLHTGVAPGIYGNDLKIDNILLDETLTAKISNYNIPLPLNKTGSESPLANRLSSEENGEKEDIYQLGILLIQVITGKMATFTSELDELKLQLEKSLVEGASKLRSVIDPSIRGTFAYDSMKTTVEFAINCLSKDTTKRPSIEDVLWNLQYSIQVQEGWTSSGNLGTHM